MIIVKNIRRLNGEINDLSIIKKGRFMLLETNDKSLHKLITSDDSCSSCYISGFSCPKYSFRELCEVIKRYAEIDSNIIVGDKIKGSLFLSIFVKRDINTSVVTYDERSKLMELDDWKTGNLDDYKV